MTQKIRPFLWFDDQAEAAARFYVSIFKNSKLLNVGGDDGSADGVFVVTFEIEGQEFMALNGGPHFTFSPAVSFYVDCATQAEVDELWEKLCDGGEPSRCGWLKDKFGVSWQIIPAVLGELMSDPDPVKSKRVYDAMLEMEKIDIAKLQAAYDA